jgi:hypothetical protein
MAEESEVSETTGSLKFDPQSYLISYYDEIASKVNNAKYDYIYTLNTNNQVSFPETMSILTDRADTNKFVDLKTYQYNSLIPRIRLYRVEYDGQKNIKAEKEFIFNKDAKYTVDDITKPIRKDNSGIKKINWKLAGTNPVTAERQVEVEIEFFFDSINAFSAGNFDDMVDAWNTCQINDGSYDPAYFSQNSSIKCDTDTTTRNYWSLLFHPQQRDDKNKYDTFNFRIKAIIGWEEITPTILSQIFQDNVETKDDIDNLTYSFFLNLIKHQFNLNEDGSLSVVASYIASFESNTFNYNYNLLGSLKFLLDNAKNQTLGFITDQTGIGASAITSKLINFDAESQLELEQASYKTSINKITATQNLLRYAKDPDKRKQLLACSTLPSEVRTLLESIETTGTQTIDDASTRLKALSDYASERVEEYNKNIRSRFYSSFISKLLGASGANPDEVPKYYSIAVNKQNIDDWNNWASTGVAKPIFKFTPNKEVSAPEPEQERTWGDIAIVGTVAALGAAATFFTAGAAAPLALTATTAVATGVAAGAATDVMLTDSAVSTEAALQVANEGYSEKGNESDTDAELKEGYENTLKAFNNLGEGETLKITFTTLGNVIDVAFKTIEEELQNGIDTNRQTLINELKRQKIMLSNISDEYEIFKLNANSSVAPTTGAKNLASVPIEMTVLRAFLIENIVKPQKDVYSLYSFIKDLIGMLILPALNASNIYNNEVNKYSDVSLATNIISFGDNGEFSDPMDSFKESNSSLLNATTILTKKSELEKYFINFKNLNKHKNYYSYYVLYDKFLKEYSPKNNSVEDSKLGVYWYTYGQDYGLIKSINFSRMDTPYLKEAKAVGKQTYYLGQFRDVYNASITMVGNNIYYPGMVLHITPSVEGAGIPSETKPNFSQITGIGGYYFVTKVESSISEEGYETKLETIWQSDGFEKKVSLTEEDKCKALLEEAGIKPTGVDFDLEVLKTAVDFAKAEA